MGTDLSALSTEELMQMKAGQPTLVDLSGISTEELMQMRTPVETPQPAPVEVQQPEMQTQEGWQAPGSEPLSYTGMMKESLGNVTKEFLKGGPINAAMTAGGEGINNLNSLIERGGYKAGQAITDLTGSPLAGATVATGINAIPMVVGGASSKLKIPKAPTREALKVEAGTNYKIAEDAGVVLKPNGYKSAVADIETMLKKEGYRESLYPELKVVLKELKAVIPKTLEELEISRRIANKAAMSIVPAEARLGRNVREKIDDYMENLSAKDITSGNSDEAIPALTKARDLWKRQKKAEIIEGYMEKAKNAQSQYSQSGLENTLRVQFRQLANNKKLFKQFNPDEQKLILSIVRGGLTQNTLRLFGKLSPNSPINAAFGGGAGFMAFGPVGAVAVPAAGAASKVAATQIGMNKVNKLDDLVRRGQKPPTRNLTPLAIGAMVSEQ